MSANDASEHKSWQEIAERIAKEPDSGKLTELANELVEAMDEQQKKPKSPGSDEQGLGKERK